MFVCSPTRSVVRWGFRRPVIRARAARAGWVASVAVLLGFGAPATGQFVVVNTADSGPGSLRQALMDAAAGTGGTVTFNIPTTDPGFNLPGSPGAWRILLQSSLPALTRPIVLNALTQPGASCVSPRIELRPDPGAGAAATVGVTVEASNCEVRGLVINGFATRGVWLRQVTGCTISCNFIGTDVTGQVSLGNGTGITIAGGSNNTIGGAGPGAGNVIAGNLGTGIEVVTSGPLSNVGNPILRNSIRGNGALGIDLGANGVTPNDDLDLDVGPNHFQNFPLITGYDGSLISGTLASLPNRRFRIEVFANRVQDPSGFGEGEEFIDAVEVQSNTGGLAAFTVPYTLTPGIRFLTATATALPPLRDSAPDPMVDGIGPRGIAPAAPTGTSEFSPTLRIGPPDENQPPVAVDDAYSTSEDTPLVVGDPGAGVLANDSDPENAPLQAALVMPASHGSVTLAADGTFWYIPDANYNGPDSFTYRCSDGELVSAIATVRLTVNPVNDAPFAVADEYTTAEDTTLVVQPRSVGVLANDIDADGDSLTAIGVTVPMHGTLSLNSDGTFTYTPAPDFFGQDSFMYRASDGQAPSAPAMVTIQVTPVNDPPTARDDSYETPFGAALTVGMPSQGVLSNDTDPENDPLTAVPATMPAGGSVSLGADGTFTYTPAPGFSGVDTFTYRAHDGSAFSPPATVRITVRGNTPPTARDDTYSTAEDTPLTVSTVAMGVLGNDSDPEAPPQVLTAMLVTTTTRGSLTFSPNGTFSYNPGPNLNGPDSFTYRVSDGFALSNIATATINVAPVNDPPVARNDSYFTGEDVPLDVAPPGVLLNDSDVDDPLDALTVTITSPPASGALSNVSGGGFRYTPNLNFNGTDTFRYRLTDPAGAQSAIAVVSITVQPQNDPPVAVDDQYQTDEDTPLAVAAPGVLSNDSDPDGPTVLTSLLVSPPSPAAAFVLNPDGSFVFTPVADLSGSLTFTYRASDGAAGSQPATVTIIVRPVNDPPIARDDAYQTDRNAPLAVTAALGVLANDTDIDSPVLTAVVASTTTSGQLMLSADGSFVYIPGMDFVGDDVFTYRALDGLAASEPAMVRITVRDVGGNQPPVARCRDVTIDARSTCPPPGAFFITPADVNNGSSDPDHPTESLVLSVSNSGPFRLGSTRVTLTVTDPLGASSSCSATVTVLGEDCNRNGVPDSCDIAGGAADCNGDGVPDECQCLWDNGMAAPGGTGGGRLSQVGGRVQVASRVADDFYLEPGSVYRMTTFSGQVLTNLAPGLRNARLEFLEDCNGLPQARPIAVFTNFVVSAEEPAPGGQFLVTYSFDLCGANLWLDGGKVYWVSLTSTVPCGIAAESRWAYASREVIGSLPRVGLGRPSPTACQQVSFDPWLPADVALGSGGCRNMAFKLGGAACPVIWDNGDYEHCPGGGGLPSGRSGRLEVRSADNFVVKPCDDQSVCFIETWVWTNGNPATGFVEIYTNECKSPGTLLFSAPVDRFFDLGETIRIGRIDVNAYRLRFHVPGWRLQRGRTYWLSSGVTNFGGSINAVSYFAWADRCDTRCDVRISPAWMGNVGIGGIGWCPKAEDLAFRIAAVSGTRVPRPGAAGGEAAPCASDVNGDGASSVDDLFGFIRAWLTGCP